MCAGLSYRCRLPCPTCPIFWLNRRNPFAPHTINEENEMAVHTSSPVLKTRRRHTPTSKAAFYWFLFAAVYCIIFYVLYGVVFKAPVFTGPWFDRIFRVGVMSYIMTLAAAAYSLRTRFMRNLPWKAQNWVWMHWASPQYCLPCCTPASASFSTGIALVKKIASPPTTGVCPPFTRSSSLRSVVLLVASSISGRPGLLPRMPARMELASQRPLQVASTSWNLLLNVAAQESPSPSRNIVPLL